MEAQCIFQNAEKRPLEISHLLEQILYYSTERNPKVPSQCGAWGTGPAGLQGPDTGQGIEVPFRSFRGQNQDEC